MVQHVDFSSSPGKDPLVPSGLWTPLVGGLMAGYSDWTSIPNLLNHRVKLKNEKKESVHSRNK